MLQVLPNLFGEWGLLRLWGRLGRGGQLRMDWFMTQQEAVKAMQALERAKRKRGYRENQPMLSTGAVKSGIYGNFSAK
jgi:predicted DNA-binding WGR domain protein